MAENKGMKNEIAITITQNGRVVASFREIPEGAIRSDQGNFFFSASVFETAGECVRECAEELFRQGGVIRVNETTERYIPPSGESASVFYADDLIIPDGLEGAPPIRFPALGDK